MFNNKAAAFIATTALAASLGLAGCGGTQAPANDAAPQTTQSAETSADANTTNSTDNTATDSASATEDGAVANAPVESTEAAAAPATPTTPEAPVATAPSQASYIGVDAAKAAALAHAGVNETDAFELKSELDTDDATVHYDVEFKANGMEYDYDIDALTGEVLVFSSEVDD